MRIGYKAVHDETRRSDTNNVQGNVQNQGNIDVKSKGKDGALVDRRTTCNEEKE